jgi:hypothetical protein
MTTQTFRLSLFGNLIVGIAIVSNVAQPMGTYLTYRGLQEQIASNSDQSRIANSADKVASLEGEWRDWKVRQLESESAMLKELKELNKTGSTNTKASKVLEEMLRQKEVELAELRKPRKIVTIYRVAQPEAPKERLEPPFTIPPMDR